MHLKYNTIFSGLFAVLAIWIIFAATPYFRLRGAYPQVDTQVIFLHFLCGILFIYFSVRVYLGKYDIKKLNHPLICLSLFLALFSLISSIFSSNFNISFAGSPQIGQGVFWYFDLTIMSIIFSQITNFRGIRLIIFINLILITGIVSFFTFFPNWKGLPLSFYYFTDYLCFYGVLTFIMLTTINKKIYINILAFLILGLYFLQLDNRAANLFWLTTAIAGFFYLILQLFKKNKLISKARTILFSDLMFVFVVVFISILILSSSVYFWYENYSLPNNIKGTLLDAPVVRGKIFETSLYSLGNYKTLLLGNGWGVVPDLLLQNMKSWHYDELRLGYNLHFHTHNEIAEHIVSIGLVGCLLFITYMFYVFKSANEISFSSKLAWLLFFKINCFWFLWVGTFAVFGVVISCFIINNIKFNFNLNSFNLLAKINNTKVSVVSFCIGVFLFYGSYLTYQSSKMNSSLNYNSIVQFLDNKNLNFNRECLSFYDDFNRGGFLLDRFLSGYSSYLLSLKNNEVNEQDLNVLYELKCKANNLIKADNFTLSLLATAMRADTDFYYKFANDENKKNMLNKNYGDWLYKANKISEYMPNRGELLLPFLSYAVNNNKAQDAIQICKKKIAGIEAFCYLIEANIILTNQSVNKNNIQRSLTLIKKSINVGLFNELVYGFWFQKCEPGKEVFCNFGLRGIPLSADIIFLINNIEKLQLEELVKTSNVTP